MDWVDIQNYFEENRKDELILGKFKILHAFHDIIDGFVELRKELTEGMTEAEIKMMDGDCPQWGSMVDGMTGKVMNKYDCNIEYDEYAISISRITKYFYLDFDGYLVAEKPQFKEIEKDIKIELNDEAIFLVNLSKHIHAQFKDFVDK